MSKIPNQEQSCEISYSLKSYALQFYLHFYVFCLLIKFTFKLQKGSTFQINYIIWDGRKCAVYINVIQVSINCPVFLWWCCYVFANYLLFFGFFFIIWKEISKKKEKKELTLTTRRTSALPYSNLSFLIPQRISPFAFTHVNIAVYICIQNVWVFF